MASVASSFSSIASYDVGMGGRGGYGNGYTSQGGGGYGATGGNFLGQTSGGYAVTGYTSLPPPGQQAAPPPPPQPPAAPPQLPSNPTSPFLQYSFAQVPVTLWLHYEDSCHHAALRRLPACIGELATAHYHTPPVTC